MRLLVAGVMSLASIDLALGSLGSEPEPSDTVDQAAAIIALAALVLVPAGVLVREVRIRSRSRMQG